MTSDRTRRVAIAAVTGSLQRVAAVVGAFLMFPRVLHAVGPEQFGIWGAASSLSMLFVIADFGIGPAIVTLVSRALVSGHPDEPRAHFTAGLIMSFAVSALIGVGGGGFVLAFVPAAEEPSYLIAVLGLAVTVPLGVGTPAWLALQRSWIAALFEMLQTAILLVGLFLATTRTSDVRVYVALTFVSIWIANLLNLWFLLVRHPELRPRTFRTSRGDVSLVALTGARFFGLAVLDSLSYMYDNVLALQLLGARAAAEMAVVQRISVAAVGLLIVLAQPLWPAFTEAAARGDRPWLFRTLLQGSALITAAALAGSGLLIAFGGRLLKIWLKTDIGIGQPLLWVVGIWIVCFALTRVMTLLMNALRILDFQLVLLSVTTLISFSLKFVLAPHMGIAGILLPTALALPFVIVPAMIWRIAIWSRSAPG